MNNNWEFDYSELYNKNATGAAGQNPATPDSGASVQQAGAAGQDAAQGDTAPLAQQSYTGAAPQQPYTAANGYRAQQTGSAYGSAAQAGSTGNNGYSTYAAPTYAAPTYEATQYGSTHSYTATPVAKEPKAKKSSGNAKRYIAAALLIVFCGAAGMGGGYLGNVMASGKSNAAVDTPSASSSANSYVAPAVTTPAEDMTTAQVAALVGPSVVEVTTESVTTNQIFGNYVTDGAGSGVIISEDGYIITNNHVVSGAQQIRVTLSDKSEYIATLVGTDAKTDVAVLKIDAAGLAAATIGDSDRLTVGEFALAVGNPLGTLGGTVTDGIISALNRDVTIDNETMNLLQTNAAVSPGNSGGGLFNARGELVGVVNAKSSAEYTEGLGFAIPINTAMSVAQELMDNGYVTGRPEMGIMVIGITDYQTAMQYGVSQLGVYVSQVNEGSAAEAAGLQVGDLFVSIDGEYINETADVTGILNEHVVGDTIEIQVVRERQVITIKLTLAEKQKVEDASSEPAPTEG